MRTRELIRLKYMSDMIDDTRFACKRYYDDSCFHYDCACDCPRNDLVPIMGQKIEDRDKSRDNCPDFVRVSQKMYQEHLGWERDELAEEASND